jgi:hypothetical protein
MLGNLHLKNTLGRAGRLYICVGKGRVWRFDEMDSVHISPIILAAESYSCCWLRVKKKLHVMAFAREKKMELHMWRAATTEEDTVRLGLIFCSVYSFIPL